MRKLNIYVLMKIYVILAEDIHVLRSIFVVVFFLFVLLTVGADANWMGFIRADAN
jgi:hypothetical protein